MTQKSRFSTPIFSLLVIALLVLMSARAESQPRSTIPGAHIQPNSTAQRELNKTDSRLRRGDFDKALESSIRAAELDSLSSVVFERLGVRYLASGMPREAYGAFRRSSLLNPSSSSSLNRAGQVLLSYLGRPAGAKAAFDQALRIDPNFAPALYSLHIYYLTRGELQLADSLMIRTRESASGAGEIAVFYGATINMVLMTGDYHRAEMLVRLHLSRVSGDIRANQTRALVERILGWNEQSAITLRGMMHDRAPRASVINDHGIAMRGRGLPDSARIQFERAWELDKTSSESGYNLSLLALETGDTALALDWLARTLARHSEWYAYPLLAGEILSAQGEAEAARRAFERAYRLNPISQKTAQAAGRDPSGSSYAESADSLLVRAEDFLEAGDLAVTVHFAIRAAGIAETRASGLMLAVWARMPSGAGYGLQVVQLEAILEDTDDLNDSFIAVVERELGNAHAQIGNREDAVEHLQNAISLDKDLGGTSAPATNSLLQLYLVMGESEKTRDLFDKIGETDDPQLLITMTRIAEENGDIKQAEVFRTRANANMFLASKKSENLAP